MPRFKYLSYYFWGVIRYLCVLNQEKVITYQWCRFSDVLRVLVLFNASSHDESYVSLISRI